MDDDGKEVFALAWLTIVGSTAIVATLVGFISLMAEYDTILYLGIFIGVTGLVWGTLWSARIVRTLRGQAPKTRKRNNV